MLRMDQVHVVRHKVLVEGLPIRAVTREMGIARNTVKHYLEHPMPLRVEAEPRARPVWGKVAERLQQLLAESTCSFSTNFVPFDRARGELLFNLLTERYERRSVIVTTNLAFGEWIKVFGGDEKLTTALLDRLADHATVIATKGNSFRMRRKSVGEEKHDASPGAALPKTSPKA
jgi:hypothetical protein